MQLFYTPDITGNQYTLNEQESKHCVRVLRMNTGSFLHLTDGQGTLFKAEITEANPKACKLTVTDTFVDFERRPYHLHIAIAPTKNIDRFEWFLEKATEIGIDEITPLICEHSERKQIKQERLERIIVSAMKQSIKAYKPKLNKLINYQDFYSQYQWEENCFIAHCQEGEKARLKDIYLPKNRALVLIGPEGDFSPAEVGQAMANGFRAITFGASRLRTETAGIVACHSFAFINI